MDSTVLVKAGQLLVKKLDEAGAAPRVALWVHNIETNTWKLWLVPQNPPPSPSDFYRKVSEIIRANRTEMTGVEAADVEMKSEKHVAIEGVRMLVRAEGLVNAHFVSTTINGFYFPEMIVLRSAL